MPRRLLLAASALAGCATLLLSGACSSSAPSAEIAPLLADASPTDPGEPPSEVDASLPPVDAGRDTTLPPNGSEGCGARGALAVPGAATGVEVDVAGKTRTYALSVPTGYDEHRAHPLVFNFHSGGRNGAGARDYFGFEGFAGAEAVFVYPDGLEGNWELDTPAAQNGDVAFFDALVAAVSRALCVDTTRIFATGSSMGAYFVNQLGCRRGDVLRAIAPHAGGGPWETGGTYVDGHVKCATGPVAAMVFVGLADTNVSPSEGDKSIAHWQWANGCAAGSTPRAPSPCVAADGCGKPVVSCRIPGVGHRIWNQGPKATWDFFASF